MRKYTGYLLLGICLILMTSSVFATALTEYVKKPDATYAWNVDSSSSSRLGTRTFIDMSSQTWQGILWKHKIELFEPARCEYPDIALLFITGNFRKDRAESMMAQRLAVNSRCPVAVIYDIPNQPLYGGKNEDALIAYTFMKFLETGDSTWPLLLPMTKGSVRAMDTVQALIKKQSGRDIKRFVVCGASKRGWTTWLTAAADPGRVKGIMPMVYDNLDLKAQMKQQVVSFGDYSSQINDYTELGLQKVLGGDEGKAIADAIDPWSYRKKLTLPKLIINGSNDPYWPQDALNLYWDGLKGPKSVLYMANSGHGLVNNDENGYKLDLLLSSMSAFTSMVAANTSIPQIAWKHQTRKDKHNLTITADPAMYSAKMWVTKSATRDFRMSKWESTDMQAGKNGFTGTVDLPKDGYMAVFGESATRIQGLKYTVSTQVQILNNNGPVK
ncbi:MAG: PhoPQ-activated pathogenicity-related family protein [Armatimonadota bacterium]